MGMEAEITFMDQEASTIEAAPVDSEVQKTVSVASEKTPSVCDTKVFS
jgi:hypothetical protein